MTTETELAAIVRQNPDVRELQLDLTNVTDLSQLVKLDRLEVLSLENRHGGMDFTPLQALPLRELTIECRRGVDYSQLGQLRTLKKMDLGYDYSGEMSLALPNLSFISKLDQLEELRCGVPVADCSYLESTHSLRQLSLGFSELVDLHSFRNLHLLEQLEFSNSPDLTDVSALSNMHALRDLKLGRCPRIEVIDALVSCTKLRSFHLSAAVVTDISILSRLPELEELVLSHCRKLNRLGTFDLNKCLRRLSIESGTFSDISGLANLQNLKDLTLADCLNVIDISVLAKLPNLRNLCLNASTNIKQIHPIKPIIDQLDWLELDNCYFDDAPGLLIGFETNCADDAREFFGFPRREPPDYSEFE